MMWEREGRVWCGRGLVGCILYYMMPGEIRNEGIPVELCFVCLNEYMCGVMMRVSFGILCTFLASKVLPV